MLRLGTTKDELGIVADQIGAPTYARDLAVTIADLISNNIKPIGVEYQHFTNAGICSWAQFAKEIFKLANIKCNVNEITTEQFPTKAERPAYSVLNLDALNKYEFIKNRNWQDALQDCIKLLN
ncbi:MAG: SDR family oxidoreductase [Bacteroidia bacterium]